LGFLHTTKRLKPAVAFVHNDVLRFYAEQGLTMQAILCDNGRQFCSTDMTLPLTSCTWPCATSAIGVPLQAGLDQWCPSTTTSGRTKAIATWASV